MLHEVKICNCLLIILLFKKNNKKHEQYSHSQKIGKTLRHVYIKYGGNCGVRLEVYEYY